MAAVPRHKQQADRLAKLNIAHRSAAHDLNVAATSFFRYLKTGELSRQMAAAKFPDQVARYIKTRSAQSTRAAEVRSMPLSGRFGQLQMPLTQAAGLTGIDRDTLRRGIFNGVWPDEATKSSIEAWIEKTLNKQEEVKMITKVSLSDEDLEHWGLKRDPFTNEMEGVDDIFDMKELSKAERKIMIAVDKNGWVAVTGPIGSGKSTLLKKVEGRLSKRKDVVVVKPRTIEKQYLGASHVCDSILEDLGTSSILNHRTLEHKARLVGRTLEEAYREGKKIIILIDEAHLLRPDALLALKRIYEFEIGFKKLLSIVLVGQVRLARTLKQNFELAEVSQRVDLYELNGLNGAIAHYIKHKLERAGMNGKEIFEPSALKAIHGRADTPLGVNNLAAACLLKAADMGDKHVTAETVRAVPGNF